MPIDHVLLAHRLSVRFGLSLEPNQGTNETGDFIDLRPDGIEKNEGFVLHVQFGWRRLESSFILETYSGDVLRAMASARQDRRVTFSELAEQTKRDGAHIRLRINDSEMDATKPGSWPAVWRSFNLSVTKSPVDWAEQGNNRQIQAFKWTDALFSMVVLLLPLSEEDTETSSEDSLGLPEGARTRIMVNRYERSRVNRAVCLRVNGTACRVCGLRLEDAYGEIGRDFIHVHHIVPVARLGGAYRIDPIRDLVPICPNCHAMAHRRSPPFSPEELAHLVHKGPQNGGGAAP